MCFQLLNVEFVIKIIGFIQFFYFHLNWPHTFFSFICNVVVDGCDGSGGMDVVNNRTQRDKEAFSVFIFILF